MTYSNITPAIFLSRPNRFIAKVSVGGKEETVHVKNTGRCRELLVPGCTVYLCRSDNPARKTAYDLIAVEKIRSGQEPLLINMDSQIPNDVAQEWLPLSGLFSQNARYHREHTHGNSRFDFYVEDGERKAFVEVKGCTLEQDGICSFPDAPTERGVKHIRELAAALEEGFECYVLFIVQMKGMRYLVPNDATHPEFGQALREAAKAGVKVLAAECEIHPDSISACGKIPVHLE
ncbi:MAG: DNA/RNA nuclease SfsA [Oscillospiraceae bacterium]|nr:DNA/RNA nuclease SfsA [Oscillospiraceae bacterium]